MEGYNVAMERREVLRATLDRSPKYTVRDIGTMTIEDPERAWIEGREPHCFFGVRLQGRYEVEEDYPCVIIPLSEDLVNNADIEYVAHRILESADHAVGELLS